MTNHGITGKQMQSILVMFWLGSLVVSGANKDVKQDYWISILISVLMFLPIVALYCRLIKLYPGKNLFEIFIEIFGKTFGRVMIAVYVIYSLLLGSMVTKVFAAFIRTVNMPETPEYITTSFLMLVAILSTVNGPENIGRIAKYTWKFIFIFIIFTIIVGFKDMKFGNLLPIMNSDFKDILGASYVMFTLPLAEAVICLSFFSAVGKKENSYKIFLKALAIAVFIFLIVALRNVLILGVPASQLFYFPSYHAVSIISLGDFFSRFEVIIGINLMLAGFIKICVCLYTASLGCASLFKIKEQKRLVAPCGLIIITITQLLYDNVQQMLNWIPFNKIYAIPFEIILPLITLIGAEIRYRVKNSQSKNTDDSEKAPSQT